MKVVVGGQDIDLGVTEGSPVIAITDYSRRVTDDFGVTTVVRRGFSRRMSVNLMVPSDEVDALQRQLADLRATPALWVAGEDLDSLSVEGFYKDFSVDLAVPPVSFCSLSIEGLVEADAGAEGAGDPAPGGQASTLRLLTPQAVTDAVLTGSNVAEDDYPQWSSLTTYAAGDRVLRTVSHRVFESAAAGNVGNDPLGASGQWIDIGPTNRWAMFDQALGTLTTRNGSISVSLDPVAPIDAIALLDVTAASIRVQAPGYDVTKLLTDGATGATFADIPSTSDTVLITVTGIGAVSIGTLLIGTLRGLGITEASPSVGIIDFSKKDVDDFGDVTLVERAWAKRMSVKALIATDAVDVVMQRLAAVRGFPVLWIGDDAFESLTLYGFYKDASITLDQAVSTLSLNVEGFSKAAALSPLKASDVAFEDGKTVEQLKPAEPGATEGMTPAEREEVDQLAGTVVDLDVAVSAAQSQIAAIEGSISDIDAPALRDDIAALQTQAASIIGSIGDIGTQVDQVETSVSTLSGSVSTLSQTVTNLNGTVSTLSSTVSTQGGQISTIAQSVTTLSGTVSTLSTIVTASSNPNLLPNGGFENGLRGWTGSGSLGAPTSWARAINAAWGTYAYNNTAWTGTSTLQFAHITSDIINGLDAGSYLTVAGEAALSADAGAEMWIQFIWATTGGYVYEDGPHRAAGTFGFESTGFHRTAFAATKQVPAGTTGVRVSLVTYAPPGVTVTLMAWRQVKLERGQIATPYSGEATAGQVFTAYSDLNNSFASLSSTVTTQGGQISNIQQVQTTQAGTVATLQTQVKAGGGNLLVNTDLAVDLRGWDNGTQNGSTFGINLPGDNWHPAGENSFTIYQPNDSTSGYSEFAQYVAVTGGKYYDFSLLWGSHRCQTELIAQWENGSGGVVQYHTLGAQGPAGGGPNIGNFVTTSFNVQAPGDAVRVRFYMRKYATLPGNYDSYAWFLRPQVTESLAGASSPVAYSVGSARATINFQAQAISTLNGQQSILSTTVSTQGAAISTLQTATSTLQGDTATLRTQVTAGSPNLLRNGGFELGNMNYWSWSAGSAFSAYSGTENWGVFAVNNTNIPDNSVAYIYSNPVGIERDYYTLTADTGYFLSGGTGHVYLQMDFLNVTGGYISSAYGPGVASGNNFSADGSTRRAIKLTALAPEGATQVRAFVVWYKASGVVQSMHVRQVKLERGQVATPYSAEASVRQSFEALSTLTSQYASLSSTVSTLNSSVSVQQTAITNLQGKTAAWWQVQAIAGSDRASAQLFAGGGFAGFDIVGDLRVTGNALIGGTVNPEALALDRFVKRIYGTGSGSPAAGQTLLLYAQDIGVTTANGSYQIELAGEMTTTVGRQTSTLGGLPYYINHNADGGLRIVINKNGSTIYQTDIHASEYITANDVGPKVYSLNRNIVVDSPGGGDASGGNATILIYAVRGNADTGAVNQGDYYTRDVSATYSGFNIAARTKWTFV